MRTNVVTDAKTGEVRVVPFTANENSELDAKIAAAEAAADKAPDPMAKLVQFLKANPDVLALVTKAG